MVSLLFCQIIKVSHDIRCLQGCIRYAKGRSGEEQNLVEMGLNHDSELEDSNLLANFTDSWVTQVPKKAFFSS